VRRRGIDQYEGPELMHSTTLAASAQVGTSG
jgi:hypothetical protein